MGFIEADGYVLIPEKKLYFKIIQLEQDGNYRIIYPNVFIEWLLTVGNSFVREKCTICFTKEDFVKYKSPVYLLCIRNNSSIPEHSESEWSSSYSFTLLKKLWKAYQQDAKSKLNKYVWPRLVYYSEHTI